MEDIKAFFSCLDQRNYSFFFWFFIFYIIIFFLLQFCSIVALLIFSPPQKSLDPTGTEILSKKLRHYSTMSFKAFKKHILDSYKKNHYSKMLIALHLYLFKYNLILIFFVFIFVMLIASKCL